MKEQIKNNLITILFLVLVFCPLISLMFTDNTKGYWIYYAFPTFRKTKFYFFKLKPKDKNDVIELCYCFIFNCILLYCQHLLFLLIKYVYIVIPICLLLDIYLIYILIDNKKEKMRLKNENNDIKRI